MQESFRLLSIMVSFAKGMNYDPSFIMLSVLHWLQIPGLYVLKRKRKAEWILPSWPLSSSCYILEMWGKSILHANCIYTSSLKGKLQWILSQSKGFRIKRFVTLKWEQGFTLLISHWSPTVSFKCLGTLYFNLWHFSNTSPQELSRNKQKSHGLPLR